ncbi:MAG: tRNA (uridine(54)-C5)-methyltransferase TrmA [Lautropia sp.]|nr:tRNA (uridine(54)-C5)-methyltransferase TrmA [Lautropia sp.]
MSSALPLSDRYRQQLDDKIARLQQLFEGLNTPSLEVFDSPPEHYRMRAEFRVWHEDDEIFYAMFEPGQKANTHSLRRMDRFPAASASIDALMPRLMAAVSANPMLRHRWYQVEFLATLSGDMLVTMIYHRRLDADWEAAARAMQDELGIAIIGRSKGQKIVLARDHVTERLQIPALALPCPSTPAAAPPPLAPNTPDTSAPLIETPPCDTSMSEGHRPTIRAAMQADSRQTASSCFLYRQPEGAFTQPNAEVCQKMIGWACSAAASLPGSQDTDLLELYCGNGNFTLPLARHFRQVLATEISKTSVAAAQWNIEANQSHNVKIARLSAEEFTEAWQGQRRFRRLDEAGIDLAGHDFRTVFVDPPRAGVDERTLRLLQRFDNILYVSCNPETLRANLDVLAHTHRITRFALFDQFPFTHHIESGVLLQRRQS